MLKKFGNWWNKPWTNGTYIKLVAICAVIYGVIIGTLALIARWDDFVAFIKRPFVKFKNFLKGVRA